MIRKHWLTSKSSFSVINFVNFLLPSRPKAPWLSSDGSGPPPEVAHARVTCHLSCSTALRLKLSCPANEGEVGADLSLLRSSTFPLRFSIHRSSFTSMGGLLFTYLGIISCACRPTAPGLTASLPPVSFTTASLASSNRR